jgi:hypothetical protein
MTPQECWTTYVGDKTPGQFVKEFDTRDPEKCAARFVREQGVVFGIVRHGVWGATFASEEQHTRDTVVALLTSYLEDHRESWEAVPISVGPPATWEAIEAATDHSVPDEVDHDLEQYLNEHDAHGPAEFTPAPEAPAMVAPAEEAAEMEAPLTVDDTHVPDDEDAAPDLDPALRNEEE